MNAPKTRPFPKHAMFGIVSPSDPQTRSPTRLTVSMLSQHPVNIQLQALSDSWDSVRYSSASLYFPCPTPKWMKQCETRSTVALKGSIDHRKQHGCNFILTAQYCAMSLQGSHGYKRHITTSSSQWFSNNVRCCVSMVRRGEDYQMC